LNDIFKICGYLARLGGFGKKILENKIFDKETFLSTYTVQYFFYTSQALICLSGIYSIIFGYLFQRSNITKT